MKTFIGTKILKGKEMNLGDYNKYRGWTIPEGEDPEKEGYLVEYEDGYESWSPTEAFKAYRRTDGMNFGLATEAMKKGNKVSRSGWNGKKQFVMYCEPDSDNYVTSEGTFKRSPYFYLKNAQGYLVPWVPSVGDCLSDDWTIV